MKHASSRQVFEYWNEQRGDRVAPERGDIEPGPIRRALGDTFILGQDAEGVYRFRLAGTRTCALFCGELKGVDFIGLWAKSERPKLRELVTAAAEESVGFIAGASGQNAAGATVGLEMLLLPLRRRNQSRTRLLGVLAPFVPPYWLGTTPVEKTLVDPAYVPLQIQKQVKDNLGGHWNHTFFWQLMTPGGARQPGGDLKTAIESEYGDIEKFKERFNEAGAARFGSGWAWLIVNKNKKLEITSTANQDTPVEAGVRAVLGVDVWEHAYYLKYQNRRPEYLKAWWNTVNWDKAAENFKKSAA